MGFAEHDRPASFRGGELSAVDFAVATRPASRAFDSQTVSKEGKGSSHRRAPRAVMPL